VPGIDPQGAYGFLLTRRWAALLATAVALAVGCVAMGFWQVDRLGDRRARNDLLERNLAAAPRPVGQVVGVGEGPAADEVYAPVRARGVYDTEHQLVVRTRPLQGQVGFYVLTPLVTRQGPALLVNRGWVPRGPTPTSAPDVAEPPAGEVTVVGRVRAAEDPVGGAAPPPGQVTRIDVPGIAATLPYRVYGGYADLVRQRPAASGPTLLPAPEPQPGPHLAYAFQWFLFACLALGGYVVLARREAADRLAAAPRAGDAPRVADHATG
jgi:cytochrome oxidase assembly protein ShyY1